MADADTLPAPTERFMPHLGPKKGVKYPLILHYCGECSMPIEYCENYPNYDKCKEWLKDHLPAEFEKLELKEECLNAASEDPDDKKKRQTRGGKGMVKAKKKQEPQMVKLASAQRGKKKKVTIVTGLATYDLDLKDASKFFAGKFSCGSSVTTGEDEIVIQGDVKDELWDIIPEKWPQIDEESIDDIGEIKK